MKCGELGAAAAIIVHETKPAAYPYEVVVKSWARENFGLKAMARTRASPPFPRGYIWTAPGICSAPQEWISKRSKIRLSREFRPVSLGVTATFRVQNTLREIASNNVVAKIEGSDPELKRECVVYSATGIIWRQRQIAGHADPTDLPRRIGQCVGRGDFARAGQGVQALPAPPKRTIVFIATTAEEQGLLGAQYYVHHPSTRWIERWSHQYRRNKHMGTYERRGITGFGTRAWTMASRNLRRRKDAPCAPKRDPSSAFSIERIILNLRKRVPVVYPQGRQRVYRQAGELRPRQDRRYIAHRYHKVTDTVRSDWNLEGAVEDAQLLFMVGYRCRAGLGNPDGRQGLSSAKR